MEAVGPYSVLSPIASGGFGQVFLGRQSGVLGRLVALKGLSAEKQDELEAVAMLIDEARIASRVRHPNVVPILDVVEQGSRIWLVMEHVHGETLARLLERASDRAVATPPRVARAIACGVLRGLHAAHEAKDANGRPLQIIHRDVSPHNVIVSSHGVARVLDFGIAKARGRLSITRHGQLKGKLAYMAPEQFGVDPVDRRVDIYAAAVLVSELFAGRRLREPKDRADALARSASAERDATLDGPIRDVVVRGLAKSPLERYATAGDMAEAIEATGELASEREVAEWVRLLVGAELDERRARWEREGDRDLPLEQAPHSSDETVSAVAIAPVPDAPGVADQATVVAPRPPARSWPIFVLALLVSLGLVAGAHLLFRTPDRVAPASAPAEGVKAGPPAVDSSPPTALSVRTSTLASAQPELVQSVVVAPAIRQSPPSAKPKKPNTDCDPPYKLDGRGVKVLKLECLR